MQSKIFMHIYPNQGCRDALKHGPYHLHFKWGGTLAGTGGIGVCVASHEDALGAGCTDTIKLPKANS